ncbi:MAG: hypothetical protein AB7G87_03745 [Clostridia bacterium]
MKCFLLLKDQFKQVISDIEKENNLQITGIQQQIEDKKEFKKDILGFLSKGKNEYRALVNTWQEHGDENDILFTAETNCCDSQVKVTSEYILISFDVLTVYNLRKRYEERKKLTKFFRQKNKKVQYVFVS